MKCTKLDCKYCMDLDTYANLGHCPYNDTCFLPPDGNGYCQTKHFFCPWNWVEKAKKLLRSFLRRRNHV